MIQSKNIFSKIYDNKTVKGKLWNHKDKFSHVLISSSIDCSAETLQGRRWWDYIFKVLKHTQKKPTKNTLPGRDVLQNKGVIKMFPNKSW